MKNYSFLIESNTYIEEGLKSIWNSIKKSYKQESDKGSYTTIARDLHTSGNLINTGMKAITDASEKGAKEGIKTLGKGLLKGTVRNAGIMGIGTLARTIHRNVKAARLKKERQNKK